MSFAEVQSLVLLTCCVPITGFRKGDKWQKSVRRNRRFEAAKRMTDYFTEDEMKKRNPLLYERLIGRYLTEEEKAVKDRVDMSNCSLSKIILEHLDLNRERDLKKKQRDEEEEANMEEFEESDESEADSDSDESGAAGQSKEVTDDFRQRKKEEFLKIMYQSFIDGRDLGFDYSRVDDNSEFDDLDLRERDDEDKYFDEEDEAEIHEPDGD